ncbi:cell division protein ZipA C-terminal FtsZ-binding domain-containing protein [Snodgrassella sp. ESL0324]|uniref:cell division protein ZipA C-terminal FtsZ-binding domain-containing protein n=1 Tax=Snodgrassella sp. ESL0324 TaxID=2705033 RepID=UPI001581BA68|nr:cell division protein ZipA C-terminal FtsZ-binding domain-containing protein [Snodgrassella sp. ESL0324]NUF09934.1 cell division protein ZipA [Snodgrassella sp. ESL0324]
MIVLVIGAAIILLVLAYNIYQESQYRKQLREQFGHANKDALLDSQVNSVRDGAEAQSVMNTKTVPPAEEVNKTDDSSAEQSETSATDEKVIDDTVSEEENVSAAQAASSAPDNAAAPENSAAHIDMVPLSRTVPVKGRKALLDVRDMSKQPLPWFDVRFDYLAYIALYQPKELHAMPRLSSRSRFRLVGCTMDDRYQIAEPIPSVYYQGFVVGLQAISRSGLLTHEELAHFGEQANRFAEQMDGQLLLTDINTFLDVARPLDDLCARVDQTIAIHLVSRTNVSGTELRSAVEKQGFELGHDGAFFYADTDGEPLFNIVTLDNTPFTSTLLANQNYRGFSMLFDIVHIPNGEKCFDQFMDMAVKLSSQLGLDLVNDKVEELSTEWLREVRRYVVDRQKEMKQVDLEPGSELAKRLFS